MRNVRSVIFGLGCLLGGAFLANYFGAEAGAQEQTATEALEEALLAQSWEIHAGPYSSSETDRMFYVVRHNHMTGETQYIGCEDQEKCVQMKLEVQD